MGDLGWIMQQTLFHMKKGNHTLKSPGAPRAPPLQLPAAPACVRCFDVPPPGPRLHHHRFQIQHFQLPPPTAWALLNCQLTRQGRGGELAASQLLQ
jgi:hypothetical protein